MVEAKRNYPDFKDLTGKFDPSFRDRLEHFFRDRETRRIEQAFWTPERKKLAQQVVEAINQEIKPFGAPPIKFRQDQIKLVSERVLGPNSRGDHNQTSGRIRSHPALLIANEDFVEHFTHEYLHHGSLRLLLVKRNGDERWRREGLSIRGKQFKSDYYFEELDEGVVQITTSQILQKHFSLESSLSWEGFFVDTICKAISTVNNKAYPTAADVFPLFQKATLGRGRLLELGKIMEKTYGRGGFRTLGRLLKEIPRKDNLIDHGSPEFAALIRFLVKPGVEFRFQQACEKPEDLATRSPGFDFSQVPEGIPFGNFIDYDGGKRMGLLARLEDFWKSLSSYIAGQKMFSENSVTWPTFLQATSGGKTYRDLVQEAYGGFLRFPAIFVNTDYMRKWNGNSNTLLVKPEEASTLVFDSKIDEQVKNLLFAYFCQEEKPVTTFQEDGLKMDFYPIKRRLDGIVDIYCLVGKNLEGREVFALAVGPKGVDPKIW